jgi:hypothetical protein
MKRIFLGFALCVGMLLTGVVNAAAGGYCSLDPTVPVGLPVHVKVDVKLNLLGTSTHVYASNNHKSTTFGGVIGLP